MINKSIINEVMEQILGLHGHFLCAFFRDESVMLEVVAKIPYAKSEGAVISSRKGTLTRAVGSVTLEDGTKGYVLLTGGLLNDEEVSLVRALFNEFGEGQIFAVPPK